MGTGANAYRTDRTIVTICGSMRFWDQMVQVAASYTTSGDIVLCPFVNMALTENSVSYSSKKQALDELHLEKIEFSSKIVVVMVDNYIGDSTQKEISYAAAAGKSIEFRNFPSAIGGTGATYGLPEMAEVPVPVPCYSLGSDEETPTPLPSHIMEH